MRSIDVHADIAAPRSQLASFAGLSTRMLPDGVASTTRALRVARDTALQVPVSPVCPGCADLRGRLAMALDIGLAGALGPVVAVRGRPVVTEVSEAAGSAAAARAVIQFVVAVMTAPVTETDRHSAAWLGVTVAVAVTFGVLARIAAGP